MSLLDALAKPEGSAATGTPPFPIINALLERLPEAEREAVQQQLDGDALPAQSLAWLLSSHGHRISASSITAYRRWKRQNGGAA